MTAAARRALKTNHTIWANDESKQATIVVAALLHDIGKFGQRARSPKSERYEAEFCPTGTKHPTHIHVLHTHEFIDPASGDSPLALPAAIDRSRLAAVAARHHKTDWTELADSCLCIADRLSSGMDRVANEEPGSRTKHIKDRLVSIFEEISLSEPKCDDPAFKPKFKYRFATLDKSEPPRDDPVKSAAESTKEYEEFWNEFIPAVGKISAEGDIRLFVNRLCATLENYLWCIPSSTYKTLPDISLYDHSLTTAAIAQALYLYHSEKGTKPKNTAEENKEEKFMLVGGDISGIQNYIFDVNKSQSVGLAKLFRARSFYLQMLTRSVILEILERCDLLQVAQVMDAAGKFMLLFPNTASYKRKLEKLDAEPQAWFYRKFKGELALNLSWEATASFNDLLLQHESFRHTLDTFFDTLQTKKFRKFDRVIGSDGYSPVFKEDYAEEYEKNCTICLKNAADPEKTKIFNRQHKSEQSDQGSDSDHPICRSCYHQINELATRLPNPENRYRYIVFEKKESANDLSSQHFFAGWNLEFMSTPPTVAGSYVFNRRDHNDYTFQPSAGYVPRGEDGKPKDSEENGKPKDFEEIAKCAKRSLKDSGEKVGKEFLGVLKADVDNLGFIFSVGLQNCLSISRFASLSRMLNHFFSARLIELIEERFRNIYVVFSGGDDLFLIGPWNRIIEFSLELRTAFREFAAQNPELTFSAGIAVENPHIPVKTLAQRAEELLERAKRFPLEAEEEAKTKNAVSLFGHTLSWEQFAVAVEDGQRLCRLIEEGKLKTAFCYRLLGYAEQHQQFNASGKYEGRKRDIKAGRFLSHMSYDFARNIAEEEEHVGEENLAWLREITQSDSMDHLQVSLHYALYQNRT